MGPRSLRCMREREGGHKGKGSSTKRLLAGYVITLIFLGDTYQFVAQLFINIAW